MPPHHELESGVPSCGTPRTHRHYVVERPPGDHGGCTTRWCRAPSIVSSSRSINSRRILNRRRRAGMSTAGLSEAGNVEGRVSCLTSQRCHRQRQMVATRCIQATPNHLDHIYSLNYACMIHNQLLVLKTRPKPTNIQCIHNQ